MSFFVHWKSILFLPTFKEFGVNSIYKYASTTRLKSQAFALQYLGQKSSKLSPKPLVRKLISLSFRRYFGCVNIFDQRLLFDHKQLRMRPLELSEHYAPGNHSKNQRLKPLRNSLNVSRAKFDRRDFWTYNSLWRWRRLVHRLSKRQSLSTAILFRATITRTIILHLLSMDRLSCLSEFQSFLTCKLKPDLRSAPKITLLLVIICKYFTPRF